MCQFPLDLGNPRVELQYGRVLGEVIQGTRAEQRREHENSDEAAHPNLALTRCYQDDLVSGEVTVCRVGAGMHHRSDRVELGEIRIRIDKAPAAQNLEV